MKYVDVTPFTGLGLAIEICGAWIWVSGDTRPHKEILKAAHFFWSPKKAMWYFRPEEYKSYNRTAWAMEKIRGTYGSQSVREENSQSAFKIAA